MRDAKEKPPGNLASPGDLVCRGPFGGAGEGRPLPLLLMERYVCARVSQECLRQRAITLACDLCVCDFAALSWPCLSQPSTRLAHVRRGWPGLAGHDEVGSYSKLWAGTGAGPGAAGGATVTLTCEASAGV